MKLIYRDLSFELTRRCDQECIHCNRGPSQNIDMTYEVVDAFFDNNDIVKIKTIEFTGGDPTLNGEMLNYIVDKIIEKGIIVESFSATIDGRHFSEPFALGLFKLNEYCRGFDPEHKYYQGELRVSNDQYHEPYDPEILKKYGFLTCFYYPHTVPQKLHKKDILPYGNAYFNRLSNQRITISNLLAFESYFQTFEMDDEEYMELRYQYLSANGNVVCNKNLSYQFIDVYSIGNVKDSTIKHMYIDDPKILKLRH